MLFAAYRVFRYRRSENIDTVKPASTMTLTSGAGIGLLSGVIGVGGGIFLSPLLLYMGWVQTRQIAGISATFILVNSIAGIAGHMTVVNYFPDNIYPLAGTRLVLGRRSIFISISKEKPFQKKE